MEKYVSRSGRGQSTNVPELELIEQVRSRPLLYDKSVKDYRKPGYSENAWADVAESLQTSVLNCKKRWKSLRDTFIKYYRLEMIQKKDARKNKKTWIYYKDLAFLIPHVELYRLDESAKSEEQNDSIPIYLKEDDYLESTPGEKQFFFAEEDTSGGDEQVTYQIKIDTEDYDDENAAEYVEERLEDGTMLDLDEDQVVVNKVIEKLSNDESATYMLLESHDDRTVIESDSDKTHTNQPKTSSNPKEYERIGSSDATSTVAVAQPSPSQTNSLPTSQIVASQRNIVDPDERYLLSCLPAFKRFSPQQKAYVRMGIEKLFYEVEFENADEPKSKRHRYS